MPTKKSTPKSAAKKNGKVTKKSGTSANASAAKRAQGAVKTQTAIAVAQYCDGEPVRAHATVVAASKVCSTCRYWRTHDDFIDRHAPALLTAYAAVRGELHTLLPKRAEENLKRIAAHIATRDAAEASAGDVLVGDTPATAMTRSGSSAMVQHQYGTVPRGDDSIDAPKTGDWKNARDPVAALMAQHPDPEIQERQLRIVLNQKGECYLNPPSVTTRKVNLGILGSEDEEVISKRPETAGDATCSSWTAN